MKTAIFVLSLLFAVAQSENVVQAETEPTHFDEVEVELSEDDSTPCTKKQLAERKKCEGMMGCHVTQCDSDGSYSAKQCSGSTGYCWCVGEDGIEFENSQQREWESGKLDCETMRAERAAPCRMQQEAEQSKCKGLMGCHVTQCGEDGSYSAKQCSASGYCWCVDENGVEFTGSRQREWESGLLDCTSMRAAKRVPTGCSSDDQCTFKGHCFEGKCVCRLACPRILYQVCGSNDETYDNECLLEVDSCVKQMEIVKLYDGVCRGNGLSCDELECDEDKHCEVTNGRAGCVCSTDCDEFDEPVCGEDDKSYKSACHLKAANCKSKQQIRIRHEGLCDEAEEVEEADSAE
ncbi:agrin-like [Corticium candelabrum]|uniref:agrin-like n=1 Tax=Corticium candelabrum TaxID=121492 RepID=UPI002E258A89|nr:agrin-like [Corticium candelabrum]